MSHARLVFPHIQMFFRCSLSNTNIPVFTNFPELFTSTLVSNGGGSFFCIPPFHGFQNKLSTFLKIHRCCSFVRNPMYTICILSGFLLYYIYIHNLTCFLLKSSCYLHRLQEQNLNDFIMTTYSHRQRNRTAVLSVK